MKIKIIALFLVFLLFPTSLILAQGSVSLSVTPTLFEMSANPGQEWKSMVKVVNVNNFDLTVYAKVVNFAPKGEGGNGIFLPVFEDQTEGATLAEWIDISTEAIVIPQQQTMEVPFTVKVPEDASPGGHFAAVMIGTKPPEVESGAPSVKTSQMVTSLFFVRIAGDVVESGEIREFRTTKSFLTKPEATFEVRFENKGNVHIQPQGDIRIFNMWGEERGVIPINRQSHYGNVLPDSIRKFIFAWSGEWALADIGRYSAQVTLGYGVDSRKFVSRKTYFWVVPLKELSYIVAGLGLFIVLVVWLVRLYVRRMLIIAGIDPNERRRQKKKKKIIYVNEADDRPAVSVTAPLRAGILDLSEKLKDTDAGESKIRILISWLRDNWKIILAMLVVILFLAGLVWYIKSANVEDRFYEVTYINSENETKVSSEEIIYNELSSTQGSDEMLVDETLPKLIIVNRSGVPGLGAKVRSELEQSGYEIINMNTETEEVRHKTVVVYQEKDQEFALDLSSKLNNALVSVYEANEAEDAVTIFIGDDINQD